MPKLFLSSKFCPISYLVPPFIFYLIYCVYQVSSSATLSLLLIFLLQHIHMIRYHLSTIFFSCAFLASSLQNVAYLCFLPFRILPKIMFPRLLLHPQMSNPTYHFYFISYLIPLWQHEPFVSYILLYDAYENVLLFFPSVFFMDKYIIYDVLLTDPS